MTFNNATLVFDVFNVGATRSGSSIWKKIKEGVIRYGTARAEDALRNGHIYRPPLPRPTDRRTFRNDPRAIGGCVPA